MIIAIQGGFDITINNGTFKDSYTLESNHIGLFVPSKHWLELKNFKPNSIVLVFTSTHFEESDYIRDFEEFESITQ